ncbi:unnamed protein product [Closterium sp. Naga37s-1]|nr:unnamed protein product [Closterium sp. Naga37s-1]
MEVRLALPAMGGLPLTSCGVDIGTVRVGEGSLWGGLVFLLPAPAPIRMTPPPHPIHPASHPTCNPLASAPTAQAHLPLPHTRICPYRTRASAPTAHAHLPLPHTRITHKGNTPSFPPSRYLFPPFSPFRSQIRTCFSHPHRLLPHQQHRRGRTDQFTQAEAADVAELRDRLQA